MSINNNSINSINNIPIQNDRNLEECIRERRGRYRELLNKARDIQETGETGHQTVVELQNILKSANELNEAIPIEKRCQHSDETLLDCKVISTVSGTLKKCIDATDTSLVEFDSNEFATKLISSLNEAVNTPAPIFQNLISQARNIIPSIPSYSYLFGACEENQVSKVSERKARRSVVRENLTKVKPETVHTRENEEEKIEDIVKMLFEILYNAYKQNGERPIKYYDYIIDTDSYGNTIENMFYFAFLIKDGRASLDLDENDNPIIKPMRARDFKQSKENGCENVQIVSSINMNTWAQFRTEGMIQQYKKSRIR